MKEVFNDKYISPTIELQLSEHIIKQETKIDVKTFANLSIPKVVKIGIIKSNEMAIKQQKEREKERIEKYGETEW
jgi:hypothetical protein